MSIEMAELGHKSCPECGAPNQLGAKYCDQCTFPFPPPEPTSPVTWLVVHKWRNHYAEDGRGADSAEEVVAAFNGPRGREDMEELSHLDYVAAQLESTEDHLVFRVLSWRPLTPDYEAGEYTLGDPVTEHPSTIEFSPLESA